MQSTANRRRRNSIVLSSHRKLNRTTEPLPTAAHCSSSTATPISLTHTLTKMNARMNNLLEKHPSLQELMLRCPFEDGLQEKYLEKARASRQAATIIVLDQLFHQLELRFVELRRERDNLRTTLTTANNTSQKSAGGTDTAALDYPEEFLCPISMIVMAHPVVDREGNTYERSAIETWLTNNSTSPITRRPLRRRDLAPNRALASLIERAMNKKKKTAAKAKARVKPIAKARFGEATWCQVLREAIA